MSGASHSLPSGQAVMTEQEQVIVVDTTDRAVGTAPKLEAHLAGTLHRAVSVFVTDGRGRVLLQRRASGKYHSADLWTNSCCGHPRPGETPREAAARRLLEEMGVACALEHAGTFHYRAELPNGLVEHEIDHVFVGTWQGEPSPDPREVGAWRWATLGELRRDLRARPQRYTAWLPSALARASRHALLLDTASERSAG